MTKAPLPFSESGAFQLVKKVFLTSWWTRGSKLPRQVPRLKSSI